MNNTTWSLLVDQSWGMAMLRGMGMTIVLSLLGMILGMTIALPMAIIKWRKIAVLAQLVDAYSMLVRGVPGLLVIYLMFFGTVQSVEQVLAMLGIANSGSTTPFCLGVLSISVISSAYSIEVFRGALDSVPRGLVEAALAVGMTDFVIFRRVIAPLGLRAALGGLNNVWQNTVKDTSLISVVGLQEIMRVAAMAAGITFSALLFYVAAGVLYLIITFVSQKGFRFAEAMLNRGFIDGAA